MLPRKWGRESLSHPSRITIVAGMAHKQVALMFRRQAVTGLRKLTKERKLSKLALFRKTKLAALQRACPNGASKIGFVSQPAYKAHRHTPPKIGFVPKKTAPLYRQEWRPRKLALFDNSPNARTRLLEIGFVSKTNRPPMPTVVNLPCPQRGRASPRTIVRP